MRYTIAPQIFEKYPGYVRGVVVVRDAGNSGPENPEVTALLRQVEADVRERADLIQIAQHPRIAAWREAYHRFGAKPSDFHSSVEAMVRRVRKGRQLPYINHLVAMGNATSLKHLLPVGGHDVGVAQNDLWLKLATGQETFVAFGSDVVEHPQPGEVVYLDGNQVLCRRWTWRQARHTLLTPDSTHVAINVDGLPPITPEEVTGICEELAEWVLRFVGGKVACRYLQAENLSIEV
jgi:DNA/RNA-binding domain of Phe-tRNA-synthetase-like protein